MISHTLRKLVKFAWFLPGFLLWAAFPPMGERTDVLFALAPLLWLCRREGSAKVCARRWFQSGLFFWVATLSWMPAIVKNGGPWPLVVLGWFALAAYCSLYFAAFGWLAARYWRWARRRSADAVAAGRRERIGLRLLGVLFVEPVLWCGLELVRSRFLGGFAWNQLGVVPVNSGFGAPAALGGVYLCSAVVILVNGTVAGIAERLWKIGESGFPSLKKFGPLETLLVFLLVFGVYRLAPAPAAEPSGGEVRVALVQRNFPCVFKAQTEDPRLVYSNLLENVLALRPELVVLPESAMCEFGPVDQQGAVRFARGVCGRSGAALLAGGTRYAEGDTYNSAALYAPEGTVALYDKVHLVPFGEFIPGDKWFPALQKLAPVGSCTPGEERLLHLPRRSTSDSRPPALPFGVGICFEDTDSALMRRLAAAGAKFLCFITNDSWFSHSDEAVAHAWQATARAVETGLPVVRVGNSGVTGTISPAGKACWLPGPNGRPLVDRRGTMFDKVPLTGAAGTTPYVVLGDVPLAILFTLLILGQILVKYASNHEYESQS